MTTLAGAASGFTRGPSHWVKTKCPDWKRDNGKRSSAPERQRALVRKREGLARVVEHLRTPGLRPGMVRELRAHMAILKREIAE